MSGPPVASRSTRRNATVTISVPLAASASRIASPLENFPVPTMRRDPNTRPAIVSLSSIAPSAGITPIRFAGRRRAVAASQPGCPSSPCATILPRVRVRPSGRAGHEVDVGEDVFRPVHLLHNERDVLRAARVVLGEQELVQLFVRADLQSVGAHVLADRVLPGKEDVLFGNVPMHPIGQPLAR